MRLWKMALAFCVVIMLVTGAVAVGGKLVQDTSASPPVVSGCQVFPYNNVWNTPITNLPVDAHSDAYINSIGSGTGMHPDFGTVYEGFPIGIPYTTVPSNQTKVDVTFRYADESDPGPYPIPPNAPVEGDPNGTGDRHVLVVQQGTCQLYETYYSHKNSNNTWNADSGAIFDLTSNSLRPADWTSADAAGLPIFPGLVRYDEVTAGAINHALRFTVDNTQDTYIWPARHQASDSTNTNYPPMGQRFRLKASFNISGFTPEVKVILTALKTYGMFVADNGSNWYLSGAPDSRWNDDNLVEGLSGVKGSDFEAVDESSLIINSNSAQAKTQATAIATAGGTPQGAVISTQFSNTLKALVTDSGGHPVSSIPVTFTAPVSGIGGTFAGSASLYVTQTNASGIATASAFTANGLTGSFTVTATATDVATPAVFQLTNLASCASPFVVNQASDNGGASVCGSLSRALLQGTTGTQITFDPTAGNELVVTGALPPVQAGVTLDGGSCDPATGPSLSIRGNFTGSSPGLIIKLGATVRNIKVSGFPGPQIQARAGLNTLRCVWAAKSFP